MVLEGKGLLDSDFVVKVEPWRVFFCKKKTTTLHNPSSLDMFSFDFRSLNIFKFLHAIYPHPKLYLPSKLPGIRTIPGHNVTTLEHFQVLTCAMRLN